MRIATAPDHVYLALNKPRGMRQHDERPGGPAVAAASYVARPARSGCSTSAGSTPTPRGCSCSPTTASWRTGSPHPSYGVPKTYLAEVTGPVARDVGKRLQAGVELEDGLVQVDSFRLVEPGRATG